MKLIRFLPEISDDLASAAEWYKKEGNAALADRFLSEFFEAVPRISENAEIHRLLYRDFRGILLDPFPYKIYFRITTEEVIIVLVIHCARSPRMTKRFLRLRTQ